MLIKLFRRRVLAERQMKRVHEFNHIILFLIKTTRMQCKNKSIKISFVLNYPFINGIDFMVDSKHRQMHATFIYSDFNLYKF